MAHRFPSIVAAVLMVLLVAGCSGENLQLPSHPSDTNQAPIDTIDPNATDSPASEVRIDPGLLAILPRSVDSIPVIEDSDGDDQIRGDDVLPTLASAAVAAVASGAQSGDLTFGYVIKLLPQGLTDGIYRTWRDTFDSGVCQGEDQIAGNASSTVKGNTVYIGTCVNGIRTYHALLKDKGLLISLWETGEKRLGLVMLGNLRE